jgi:dihydroxyacetone kinase DhaKLM complex PTS-EIIA-like component DhaM
LLTFFDVAFATAMLDMVVEVHLEEFNGRPIVGEAPLVQPALGSTSLV